MIKLYLGSGSASFRPGQLLFTPDDWTDLRHTAVSLLATRGNERAAGLLESCRFAIHQGENDFGDEFELLYREVTLAEYVRFDSYVNDPNDKQAFKDIAKTLTELGHYIRFIAVGLNATPATSGVSAPKPQPSTATVERALVDAEQLLKSSGPVSAIDRAHTALHGYIKHICCEASLCQPSDDLSLTDVTKKLRESHPDFSTASPHSEHTQRILRGIASIVDALNPIRNRGSVAHPNDHTLDDVDAMLAINSSRTILHYVDGKLQKG